MVNKQKQLAEQVAEWARLKVPYVHRGITRRGCDCTGLLIGAAQEIGFDPSYKIRQYPPDWNLHSMAGEYITDELSRFTDPITVGDVGAGDIIVFKFGRCVSHLAVMTSEKMFVHCYFDAGKCVYGTTVNSPWTKRIAGAFRIRNDAYEKQIS